MLHFLFRKIPSVVMVVLISSMIAFTLPRLAPGDPAVVLAGPDASPSQVDAIRTALGLNRPLIVQYFVWLKGLLHGDLGRSYLLQRPVSELVGSRLESTLELALVAAILMVAIGMFLGILSGSPRRKWARSVLDAVTTIFLATPAFLSGLILILIFGIAWHLLPISGEVGLSVDPALGMKFLILPGLALALPQAAVVARLVATAMINIRGEDFVDLAVAKGVPTRVIMRRHVLRNSLGTAITAIGLRFGELLGGALVTESIFARNGLGALAITSVQGRDYLVLEILILGAVLVAVTVQLLSEVAMASLDPRIRLETR